MTKLENEMLKTLANNDYATPATAANPTWSWHVCETRERAGALGSLVKKGLAETSGSGMDAACWLTREGLMALGLDPAVAG